jgi:hypothetical protein
VCLWEENRRPVKRPGEPGEQLRDKLQRLLAQRNLAAEPPSRLANEAVVTAGGPHPRASWEPSPPGTSLAVLPGRATHVPEGADSSGIPRTTTVTSRDRLSWLPALDLGGWRSPKLHGIHGVRARSSQPTTDPAGSSLGLSHRRLVTTGFLESGARMPPVAVHVQLATAEVGLLSLQNLRRVIWMLRFSDVNRWYRVAPPYECFTATTASPTTVNFARSVKPDYDRNDTI